MFRISIIFFKLIGLSTFTHRIVTHKKRTSHTFQYSKFGIVYNIVLCSLMMASNYISIPFWINREYNPGHIILDRKIHVGIKLLQTVLGTSVISTILLNYCIHQKSLVRIANRLMNIEYEINRLYDLYRPLRRKRIFCTIIVVCILKICLLISVLITEIRFLRILRTNPISWLADVLPTFYINWLLIQYFLLLTIIQADFADVNRMIQNFTRCNMSKIRPDSLCHMRVVVSNSTVHQLLQLQDMHRHLCEISENVSSFYSLPILFSVTFLFLTFILNGYHFLPLITTFASDDVFSEKLSNAVIWLIFLIYSISLLTHRITKILIEMEKTGNVVHGLLSCAIGEETKLKLKQISLQLLHRKVYFTANGYFMLDNTFLHSLIGTTVTYLVILMQFQMGSLNSSSQHFNCTK